MSFDEDTIRIQLYVEDEAVQQAINDSLEEVVGSATGGAGGEAGGGSLGLAALGGASRGLGGGGAIASQLMSMIPYLGPILVAAGVATYLFKWARGPGGPIDKRFERELRDETLNFMSRQLQHDTQVGFRQVIIQASANFRNLGGTGNSNSLYWVKNSGDKQNPLGLTTQDTANGLERLQ